MNRKRVGIVGAGQLGRMLALAGYPLGVDCRLLDPGADAPGAQVADALLGALDDVDSLRKLAASVDVLTLEIENVDVAALEAASERVAVYPPPRSVAVAQDRLSEKTLFRSLGIPTAAFVAIDSERDLADGASAARLAGRLEDAAHGLRRPRAAHRRFRGAPRGGVARARPCSLDRRSVGAVRARSLADRCRKAPIANAPTIRSPRTCIATVSCERPCAPYVDQALQTQAEQWLGAIMGELDYRGVLTVEFFHTKTGLVANEMAPRVHNSGHWTIEGAETSQFENHLRAVLGWPLGDTRPRGHAAMLNLLGSLPDADVLLAVPGAHFHDYGKDPRPGRKVGHCTLVDPDRARLLERFRALRGVVPAQEH